MNMEYYGHVFLHQLQEMPLRASQVRLQTTLQIPAIKDTPIFILTPEIEEFEFSAGFSVLFLICAFKVH